MTTAAFSVAEIGGPVSGLVPVARRLEAYSIAASPAAAPDLADRIMAAVARESAPTPPVQFVRSLSQGSVAAAFGYLSESLGTIFSVGRSFPLAVRAQAIALVLTVALALAGGGAALAAGAAAVLRALEPPPAPRPAVITQPTPTPSPKSRTTPSTNRGKDNAGSHSKKTPQPAATPRHAGAGDDGRDGEDRDEHDGADGDDGVDGHDGDDGVDGHDGDGGEHSRESDSSDDG